MTKSISTSKRFSLEVKCRFSKNGCKEIRKLELIRHHEKTCVHNICSECGCQRKSVISYKKKRKQEVNLIIFLFQNHKCVDELKKIISKLKIKLETVRGFFDCFYFKIQINIVNLFTFTG
jgi:hypothetical protein